VNGEIDSISNKFRYAINFAIHVNTTQEESEMFWKNASWAAKKTTERHCLMPIDGNSGLKPKICSPTNDTRQKNIKVKVEFIRKKGIGKGSVIKIPSGEILVVTKVSEKGEIKASNYSFPINPVSVEVIRS
jgi:hypothetical protein